MLKGGVIKTIGDVAHGRDNNFSLLRAIAASAVLLSHSWPIVLGKSAVEPLYSETGYKLGASAVFVFFAISGFFITKSFDLRSSIVDFAIARVARLYPALIVVTILTVLLLGPAFSDMALGQYLEQWKTWTFIPHSLGLVHIQWGLPGVFARNAYGGVLNGSLWTLYYEVLCYAMVMAVGLAGLLRAPRFLIFIAIFLVAQIVFRRHDPAADVHPFLQLSLPFASGMICYVYRSTIPVSGLFVLALGAGAILTAATPAYHFVYPVGVAYAALWIGLIDIPIIKRYNKMGDYSYGIYIYAFPVQQAVFALIAPASPWLLVAISAPITLALAYLSWSIVEKPVLDHRHLLTARIRLIRARDRSEAVTTSPQVLD